MTRCRVCRRPWSSARRCCRCFRLGALPECTGRVVLLPYRAVGVTGALLPAFRPDSVMIDGAPEPMLLALSAQALTSDGAFSMVLPPKS